MKKILLNIYNFFLKFKPSKKKDEYKEVTKDIYPLF